MQRENSSFITSTPTSTRTFNNFPKPRHRIYSSKSSGNRVVERIPIMTSTPKSKLSSKAILKENLGINSPENSTKHGLEVNLKPQNREKSKRKFNRKLSKATMDEKNEAKRREKATEAMRILEKRRIWLLKDKQNAELASDDLEKLSLNEALIEISPATLKRKEAKLSKEKRIREFLAEQEARKNAELLTPTMNLEPVTVKPRRVLFNLPNENSKQFFKFQQPIIKYSSDEIRSLNPYGYYFM
jgi:hypothetical protein